MGQSESDHPLVIMMSSISLLLPLVLVPLAVSSFPVSLVSQAESLKKVLRFVDRNPTYAQVLYRAGVRADVCIEDIEDIIDEAIDRNIDDAIEAGTLRKVAIFLTKYREPIVVYSRNNRFMRTSLVGPMVQDLANLCRDVRYRAETVVSREQKYWDRIAQIF